MHHVQPIAKSYWVLPGQLLASEYPGSQHIHDARTKVHQFLEAGFTSFIDLTEPNELIPYTSLLEKEAINYRTQVQYQRLPIVDQSVPRPDRMQEILDAIDQALAMGHKVCVHCWGGVGRTGTVIGCYRVRNGWSWQAALGDIAWRFGQTPKHQRPAPENHMQREFIRTWHEHDRYAQRLPRQSSWPPTCSPTPSGHGHAPCSRCPSTCILTATSASVFTLVCPHRACTGAAT
ncbi:MAG: hypothetical protein HC876_07830 [Chloroflexaceae bacterium]|nr:hypothetical protein [Chloroflexaceae bacterium]